MKTNKWMSMAAVLTLSASLAVAAPHEGRKHGRGGRGEFGARMAQKLNLTDAQKEQIRELRQSFRESNKAFFQQAHDTRRQMREARESGDQGRLEALKATAQSQRQQLKALHQEQQQKILTLLTPEQRSQWETFRAEREARRGKRGNRR